MRAGRFLSGSRSNHPQTSLMIQNDRAILLRSYDLRFGASPMKKPAIPLGLVFSQSGPYAMMGRQMQKSALMAVDEINESDDFDFTFAPHLRDPRGVVAAYHTACADLIREER